MRFAVLVIFLVALNLRAQTIPAKDKGSSSVQADELSNISPEIELAFEELCSETASASVATTTNDAGPTGIVPATPGINFSLGATNQHDSTDGWQSIFTPNLAYRFNRHLSVNVTVPVYAYIDIYGVLSSKNAAPGKPPINIYGYNTKTFLLGDTDLVGEFESHRALFEYTLTATVGLATGNDALGLGAGQTTYSFNNHFEHSLTDWLAPELELGIGDSENLDDLRARKSYTEVGTNAHFQIGIGFSLPHGITFTTDAYEDLPLAAQTVVTATANGKKGNQLKTVTTNSEKSIGEDNGSLNTLDIPLNRHVTLSGLYNRSLRNKVDTAGFSLTFSFRKLPQ